MTADDPAHRPGRRTSPGRPAPAADTAGRHWARWSGWCCGATGSGWSCGGSVLVGLFAYVEAYYQDIFTTQEALDDFAAVSNVPSIKALTGLAAAPNTMGGAVWTKIWMTCALCPGLRRRVPGHPQRPRRRGARAHRAAALPDARHRTPYSVASWLVNAALCVAVGVGVALVSAAGGLDPAGTGITGSLILGASMAGVGLVAIGVGVDSPARSPRPRAAANGLGSAVLGLFYLLRMVGDLGDGRLTWACPDRLGPADAALGRQPVVAAGADAAPHRCPARGGGPARGATRPRCRAAARARRPRLGPRAATPPPLGLACGCSAARSSAGPSRRAQRPHVRLRRRGDDRPAWPTPAGRWPPSCGAPASRRCCPCSSS